MAKDLKFSSKDLLNIKFKAIEYGYNPNQVDEVFDEIIKDYEKIEKEYSSDVQELLNQIAELKKQNASLAEQLQKEKSKISYLPKDQKEVHVDNFVLLTRIGKLESIIFEKLNMNPYDIK